MADYCNATDVNNLLGGGLTSTQLGQASSLCPAATAYIDSTTNRSWQGGAVVAEHHPGTGGGRPDTWFWGLGWWGIEDLWLNQPFTSITNVYAQQGLTTYPLDYDIINPIQGLIRVRGTWYGRDIYVSYLPSSAVPADIKVAAQLWVSAHLLPALHPERIGLKQISIGDRELQIWMEDPDVVMKSVDKILANYRLPVFA